MFNSPEHSFGILVCSSASLKARLFFNQSGPCRHNKLTCNSDIVIPLDEISAGLVALGQ